MKFMVLSVGHKMPAWINLGFAEYARRMPSGSKIALKEIKPAQRSKASPALVVQWLALEALRVKEALPARCVTVVLDERGTMRDTKQFASLIEGWRQAGRDIAFVIGGPDGTAHHLREGADAVLSLSAMTLPHGLCRIVLAEQLYRAISLLHGHPYHRQ
jgi:23S rRNA (pseudouridine1915-N3)-methyltransferase